MSKSLVVLDEQTSLCCAPGVQLEFPSQQPSHAACCAPLSRGQLTERQAEEVALLLKVLAHPVRLRLMSPCLHDDHLR
jgi:hypothetical protein